MDSTIEIIDPGWDWGLTFLVAGAIMAVPLLGLLVTWILGLASPSPATRRKHFGRLFWWGVVSMVAGLVALLASGATGSTVWGDRFTSSIKDTFSDKGYSIARTESTGSNSGTYIVLGTDKDGNSVSGVIYHLYDNTWQLSGGMK